MISIKKRFSAGGRVPKSGDEGIILIVVLWVMAGLAVLTLSFSREIRVEIMTAGNARSMEKAYYIARAGMESTIYQIIQKRMALSPQGGVLWEEPDQIDLGKVTGSFDGGFWQVNVQDESGKININTVSEQQLDALIRAVGIEGIDADILIDSILDWRDANLEPRNNGAKDDYYQSLDPPYTAKKGRFDAVEELLLVRGMTHDYFYGKPERVGDGTVEYKYGLSRFFTVYTTRDQINVNYAALPTLISIPGMPPEAAQMIHERRLVQPFQATAEIIREIPIPLSAGVINRLTTTQTGILNLTAEAHEEGSRVRRVIRAVISIGTIDMQNIYQVLYWNENISDYEGGTS